MTIYGFNNRLAFSRGVRETTDLEVIKQMLTGSVSVTKTDEAQDRKGVDYIATLRGGAQVLIDAKAREYRPERPILTLWQDGEPELALEKWSVTPESNGGNGKTGWTLKESSNVDMILFTFDPRDTPECFLIGFQNLRIAFRHYLMSWERRYKKAVQTTVEGGSSWKSMCIYIPIAVVLQAIVDTCSGTILGEMASPTHPCPFCGGQMQPLVSGEACPDCQIFGARVSS